MKVLPLNPQREPEFWEYAYQDIPDYYFFILDMTHDRASTKILLAFNEQDRIKGMMMTYQERIVQLRGNFKAAKALLAQLDIENVEIQGLKEHEPLILEKFKKVKKALELMVLTLKKGEETPHTTRPVERLHSSDAEEIAALMNYADPEWWGEVTAKEIADEMQDRLWLGIRVDGQLVSIGGATVHDWGSCITTVATHEDHRNKGYATSVVSTLVDRILQKSGLVLIYVESDNAPAVHTYTKVGFNPYRRYFVARTEKTS